METSVVVAFADSPALRETLSVLLEHECHLQFLPRDAVASVCGPASLALVALAQPAAVVHDLRVHWPVLPVVAVDVQEPPGSRAPQGPPDPHVCHVPLEPHAIRSSVIERLAPDRDATLRATVRLVAQTLRADVSYAHAAMRSFAALHAASVGPDTYALLGAVMREQSYVLGETVDQMQLYRARPRSIALSAEFSRALCRQLQAPSRLSDERGMLCDCRVDAACPDPGPLELVPTVAGFLRAHLRRRADTSVVGVQVTRQGINVSYPRRRGGAVNSSWPLLLAALALQPWAWSISTHSEGSQEVVRLRAVA